MIKKAVLNVWKDPVWSKVIATAIVGLITITLSLISAKINVISFVASLKHFLNYGMPIWVCGLILLPALLLFYYSQWWFKYDSETLELDRKLFNKICNEQGMIGLVLEIKGNGFSSSPVKFERIETLIYILEESKKPDFEFINPKLDQLKSKLIKEFEMLDSVLNKYIFGTHNVGWVSIPSEWEYDQPEMMQKAQQEIEKQENSLSEAYQNFVSKGRRFLKV